MVYVVPKKDQLGDFFFINIPGTNGVQHVLRRSLEKEYLLDCCNVHTLAQIVNIIGMPGNKSVNEICEEMKNYIQFEE